MTKSDNHLARLNFFYKTIFENDIDMKSFDNRIKLQKLVYILKSEGVDLGYDFTWYIRGPYSSDLAEDGFNFSDRNKSTHTHHETKEDLIVLDKLTRVIDIIKDSNNAELVASFLFLRPNYGINATQELVTRKPRFTANQIQKVMDKWYKATNNPRASP